MWAVSTGVAQRRGREGILDSSNVSGKDRAVCNGMVSMESS